MKPSRLIAGFGPVFGGVDRDQVVVGAKGGADGCRGTRKAGMEHLVRRGGDARHEIARAEGGLFHLGEVVHGVAVEGEFADHDGRHVGWGQTLVMSMMSMRYLRPCS
jgi:hypothetical protein